MSTKTKSRRGVHPKRFDKKNPIRVTLAECRQLYEEFTGKDMPKNMPYAEAAQYVLRHVGDIDFKKRLASIRRRKGMKGNPTPSKRTGTRLFNGVKHYYVGRTLYWNKAGLIKDMLKEKGLGVAVTKSKSTGYGIWATEPVYVSMMEVGGSELFNPIRKERRTGKKYWKCRFCEAENKSTGAGQQTCEKCGRPKASYQKMYSKGSRP